MRNDFNELFESILDNMDVTDNGTSARTLADVGADEQYQYSIWLIRDSQILQVFKLDSSLPEEENKERIREMCPVLYRNMFDVLHSLLDATLLIRDGYEISFVCMKNQLNH